MDLEHLNRTQTILLTLLVSVVTSIATGIVTVSLVNQAPPQLEATVNHVIEHTIEEVGPASQTAPATVVKTVIEDEDLAPASIAEVQKSIIRLVASSSPTVLVARGIVIDPTGIALTDASLDPTIAYEAILPDGSEVPAVVRPAATSSSVALVDLQISTSTVLVPATFADPSDLQLGQSVIRIGGAGPDTVAEGVIAALPQSSSPSAPLQLQATVSSSVLGSVLISLNGEVIAISTTDSTMAGGPDVYSIPSIFTAAAGAAEASSTAAAAAGNAGGSTSSN